MGQDFFIWGLLIVPGPFVEKPIPLPFLSGWMTQTFIPFATEKLFTVVASQLTNYMWVYFWTPYFVPLIYASIHSSILHCLTFWFWNRIVWSSNYFVHHSQLFCCCYPSPFLFHVNFTVNLFISTKKSGRIFIGIILKQ